MAPRERTVSPAQRNASLAVLALVCASAAYLLARQPHLNPAVEVSLRAPAPKSGAIMATGAAASGTAGGLLPAADTLATPVASVTPVMSGVDGAKLATLASLLPDAVPGPGLNVKALAPPESFTPDTLSDKINGKAELYLAAGFAAMASRSYQTQASPPGRVEVYLYRMKSPDAAFAVFSGQRRSGAAQSPLAKNGYLTENALFLTSGLDYLEVIGDRAGQRPVLEALAKAVLAGLAPVRKPAAGASFALHSGVNSEASSAVNSGAKPAAQAAAKPAAQPVADLSPPELFPVAGLKPDSIRLAVADAFGCQGLTSVYTAEYDASFGGAAALLSCRKDAAEAKAQLELYRRHLTDNGFVAQPAHSPQSGQSGQAAPSGAVVLALEGIGVEVLFTRGQFLAGVHEAPDLATALRLAAALDSSLKAKGLDRWLDR
ncbi:MAG: hypothetical protein Q8S17_05230 [Humidesulfovibrio sp.]|nr:hypothetical protein [Humidesulfovibrio sp.]